MKKIVSRLFLGLSLLAGMPVMELRSNNGLHFAAASSMAICLGGAFGALLANKENRERNVDLIFWLAPAVLRACCIDRLAAAFLKEGASPEESKKDERRLQMIAALADWIGYLGVYCYYKFDTPS